MSVDFGYGYFWFRDHRDGSTFIALRDEGSGHWFMPAVGHPILESAVMANSTLLGAVPRTVAGGGSIDQ
jgi:hypothetical protein